MCGSKVRIYTILFSTKELYCDLTMGFGWQFVARWITTDCKEVVLAVSDLV